MPTKYKANHIRRLHEEAQARCNNLLDVLNVPTTFRSDFIEVNGCEIRMAVDDFKSVLSEIRRLK
ncbi:MAG: hypothetical protein V3V68_05040 [Nitrosomonadaceae bacterium]